MKMKYFLYTLTLLAAGLICSPKLSAQDAHTSQLDALPILLSPSNTGMSPGGDLRMGVRYRNQWTSLSSNITTFGLAFDIPYGDRFGFGAAFTNKDEANILTTSNFLLSGAYLISDPNQNKFRLSTGLQLGFLYKRVNPDNLVFDDQYNGSIFDGTLPTRETLAKQSRIMPDVNFGISYVMTDRTKKVNGYFHGSIFHITSPNESFVQSEKSKLPLRWLAYGGAKINAGRDLVLDPQILFQIQRASREIDAGMMAYYDIEGTAFQVLGGVIYRVQDAVSLNVGIKHNFNTFRISYDFNTSPLKTFSNMRGGVEFTLSYTPGRRRLRAIY